MTTEANLASRFKRRLENLSESHLFPIGQTVRLRGGLLPDSNIYRITAKLPSERGSPRYRIRSDSEKFERTVTEANLDPVAASPIGERAPLPEQTFGAGKPG